MSTIHPPAVRGTWPRNGPARLARLLAVSLLAACAPSGGPEPVPGTGSISGTVSDAAGRPVAGANVWTGAGQRTTTGSTGEFAFQGLAPTDRLAVNVSAPEHIVSTLVYPVRAGEALGRPVHLLRRAAPVPIDAAAGGEIALPGQGRLRIPPRAFVDANGRPVSGRASIQATFIDPADAVQVNAAPGDYTTMPAAGRAELLRTFGMLEVYAADSLGAPLAMARGISVSMQWPGAERVAEGSPGLYDLDTSSARWVSSGNGTGNGGTFTASWPNNPIVFNVDEPIESACIATTVVKGTKLSVGELVTITGVSYSGSSQGFTGNDGTARIQAQPGSQVIVSVASPPAQQQVTTPPEGPGCPSVATLVH